MQRFSEPPIKFSAWTPWQSRRTLSASIPKPTMGVYLWARFPAPPTGLSAPYPELREEIIYVGETNDLNVRPLGGKRHDSVGKYTDLFRDDPEFQRLYVAVCAIVEFRAQDRECHGWRAFTRHLEARIGWEYTKQFGRRPWLDYKRGKDEFALPDEWRANMQMEPTRR